MCMGGGGGGYSSPSAEANQAVIDEKNLTPEERAKKYPTEGTYLTAESPLNSSTYLG